MVLLSAINAIAQHTGPKVSWHWHMHQPIYWNARTRENPADRYEYAWESIQMKRVGPFQGYPQNDLEEIFGKADRVAAYQWQMRNSINTVRFNHANAGVVTSYSGALMENVASLGFHNWCGENGCYSNGWRDPLAEAWGWRTSNNHTRLDIVNFSYHHALSGLLDDDTNYMSIRLHQEKVRAVFGQAAISRGYFPTEMCFSVRLIPVLRSLGIEWSIVSGEKIARACPDFPVVLGSGGINTQPPNKADQRNPNGEHFIPVSIDRGNTPRHANPMSYQPAWVRHVDPVTGQERRIIAIPADMSQGWRDGYACINGSFLTDSVFDGSLQRQIPSIMERNDPAQPSLVLLSHDGDNAFGGGFTYYNECVPNLANDVAGRGGEMTSIEQYLHHFTPAQNRVIHVEDGGWVYADSDFGSPTYINWNFPLLDAQGNPDPRNGWHEKPREMAIFNAYVNRVLTAEAIAKATQGYARNFAKIMTPDAATHMVDRAWHYYLGSMDSGNVYYGTVLDHEIKGTIGVNEVERLIGNFLSTSLASNPAADTVAPSIWLPQRWPYNPGGRNFGVEHRYREYISNGDFTIWTFIYDVSGPVNATLKYRIDNDGRIPLDAVDNFTYAGGPDVGNWVSIPMVGRDYPAGDIYNKGGLDYELPMGTPLLPAHISRHYHADVVGLRSVLIDYYVEAVDAHGNVRRSPIQHVYIGSGEGANGGTGDKVTVTPAPPQRGRQVTVVYDPKDHPLSSAQQVYFHNGFNFGQGNWASVQDPRPAMTRNAANKWEITYTVPENATAINFVFTNNEGVWDNNGGADWIINTVEPTSTEPLIQVNKDTITRNVLTGSAAADDSFTVRNSGAGTLDYTVTVIGGEGGSINPVLIRNYLLGISNDSTGLDLNGDGEVNVADLILAVNGGGAPISWLTVSPLAGSSTGTANTHAVTFNTTALPAGTYQATIRVAGNATNSPADIAVTLTIGDPAPVIARSPASISTQAVVGTNAANVPFTVNNSGTGTLSYNVAVVDTGNGTSWLSVAPLSGSSTGTAVNHAVSFASSGLATGSYSARIDITASGVSNSPQSIPVTLTITESVPAQTTVVPNPPTAGQGVRVWYRATGGPIAGATAVNLHWGINGGATGGSDWQQVTTTPMTQSSTAGMWYADITLPTTATSLNFVTNNNNNVWDNNNNQNWNFAVLPAGGGGQPSIGLNRSDITATVGEGFNAPTVAFDVTNAGTGVLNFTVQRQYTGGGGTPGIAPRDTGGGNRKTIAIDGVNTAGEWTDADIVSAGRAFDHANVVNGAWSTHETQFDYTNLYAAWDDTYLYVAVQIVDVIDVEDPANAGSSNGTIPQQINMPQFIAINTGPGGYGSDPVNGDMWAKGHGYAGDDRPNYYVYFASNFFQGPFVCPWNNGWNPDVDAWGPVGQIYKDHPGLAGASARHDAGGPIIGPAPSNKNYRTLGHNTNRNSFYEVRIPLELIGSPNLDSQSIGIFMSHGDGPLMSGVDSIPKDPATVNTSGVTNSNSPNEWEDFDVYTVPFAKVGRGDMGGGADWLSVAPTSGSLTEGQSTQITATFNTSTLAPGTYTANIVVSGNAANSPRTIPVTITVEGGGPPPPASITLNKASISATGTTGGSNPANDSFTVRNSGGGSMEYTVAKVNTGNGTTWYNVNPASGTSTGNTITHTVSFNTAGLTAGTYTSRIDVAAPGATNTPQSIAVTLTISDVPPPPPIPPIIIGAGPIIGTNTEGVTYRQEFQDWVASDLRALDTNDAISLGDEYTNSRDLVAFYSRFEDNKLFMRADFLDLFLNAEQGFLDLYVLIDCAPGGSTTLPNGISGSTGTGWNLMVAVYDSVNFGVQTNTGTNLNPQFLGSYWRSDLDSVEFGINQAALTTAGWNGTSPIGFYVFTARDFGTQVADTFSFQSPIMSNWTTGRAKFATIAHGNQSLNRGDSMRDRIYIPASQTGVGAPSGFRMTLDTHTIFQIPLNIHMSATLIAAIHWIKDPDPKRDGQTFLDIVGSIIDDNQAVNPGAKIGGVFSEHIMPFFEGPINMSSIRHFDDMTRDMWGIDGSDMLVMHIPERVVNARAGARDTWDDILESPYIATYIDEVAHIRDWFYPNDPWTGIGGVYGVPRQHKIHKINGVYNFLINDLEDQYKFWPQNEGAHLTLRTNLLWKALDSDQQQLTLIFDDWEALAGYSFGSGYNNNAIQYNTVMRWIANKPWIEVVTLKDILQRAIDPSHPQYSANWVIDQGQVGNKPFNTYDYLHHATQNSYENWYFGHPLEESFRDAVPVVSGVVGNGTPMPSGKIFGDVFTPGTIIYDTWAAVAAAPAGNLRDLAEMGYSAMIYETAWHDEDNTNYERDPATNHHTWLFPDTTFDRVSGWAFTLHNHLRQITVTTTAAHWAHSVRNGTFPGGVVVQSIDLDQDGQPEYVLANNRIWMAFEARGGRCTQAYYFDPVLDDAISFLGTSVINNPSAQGEEEGTSTASRCSGFKEMNDGIYADAIYTVAPGATGITFTSPNGLISKTISLTAGSPVVTAQYNNATANNFFVRMGVGVNSIDLLLRGRNFVSTYTTSSFSQKNNTRGRLTIDCISNSQINQIDEFTRFVIPLTEQMEVRVGPGASTFTLTLSGE